ncbi:hypothetical protein F5144DRAFT_288903 [Chaetomium tenue]|uniref:Uncharacterized protein n=1 Tax=Chaetomium tenue TaxID=1854479 RepID=A0ACB7P424_9PEZI|nr:hypothetical protein F5144DRAFT_288903 [Chaetomium globosum]
MRWTATLAPPRLRPRTTTFPIMPPLRQLTLVRTFPSSPVRLLSILPSFTTPETLVVVALARSRPSSQLSRPNTRTSSKPTFRALLRRPATNSRRHTLETPRKDVTPEHYYIETDYEGRLPPSYKGKKNGVLAPVMRPLPAVETAVTNGNDNDDEDENESEYEYANEFPWQVCNTVLPVHSVDQREPSPNQTLSYTAWTVNRLARQSGKEGLLWTILNKGGATYLLARVIKLKSRRNGAQVVFSALKFERHQQRTAIAAHVKLPQLNTDPCTGCASSTSTGPFSTCIQTGEFIGGCTNCSPCTCLS